MKGYLFAALAAALYGTNPIFAVPLYGAGLGAVSVLLYRYALGIPILAIIIICRSDSLVLRGREVMPVSILGIVMALSSLGLYEAYNHMSAGVASTLLFMYPVLTALIMTFCFHEKFRPIVGVCLILMAGGLWLLMNTQAEGAPTLEGFIIIFLSSLTYAIYLVMARVSKILPRVPVLKSLLWQLISGSLVFVAVMAWQGEFVMPRTGFEWANIAALAVLPTVLSLLFTIKAIESIGPTPTAIFGALEPITAVVLSMIILGESITLREIAGAALILLATMLVALADEAEKLLRGAGILRGKGRKKP